MMKSICAPWKLPNINACEQGMNCVGEKTGKGPKLKESTETNLLEITFPIDENYPTVKGMTHKLFNIHYYI